MQVGSWRVLIMLCAPWPAGLVYSYAGRELQGSYSAQHYIELQGPVYCYLQVTAGEFL